MSRFDSRAKLPLSFACHGIRASRLACFRGHGCDGSKECEVDQLCICVFVGEMAIYALGYGDDARASCCCGSAVLSSGKGGDCGMRIHDLIYI